MVCQCTDRSCQRTLPINVELLTKIRNDYGFAPDVVHFECPVGTKGKLVANLGVIEVRAPYLIKLEA